VSGAVAARETDHVRVVKGPKVAAAFAADGSPTKALEGFLRGQGATLDSAEEQDVNGVRHVVVKKHEAGGAAPAVLAGVLAKVVAGLRASKNMRWSDPQLSFSGRVRWLTALWVTRSCRWRSARWRRAHHPGAAHLRDPLVEVVSPRPSWRPSPSTASSPTPRTPGADRHRRPGPGLSRRRVDVAGEAALIDQITYLVEAPTPLLGTFDEGYLALPAPCSPR